jgi:hypothetical protein
MSFHFIETFTRVPESYSRELDERVAFEEMPYGYDFAPPPADTHDFDQHRIETHHERKPRKMK